MRDEEYDKAAQQLIDDGKKALAKKLVKKEVYTVEEDMETGEPTGNIIFKASVLAGGVFKKGPKKGQEWTRPHPVIFDNNRNKINKPPEIWGGSILRVMVEPSPYVFQGKEVGVSLKPVAVKLIKLFSAGSGSVVDAGAFSDDDDGEDLSYLNDGDAEDQTNDVTSDEDDEDEL